MTSQADIEIAEKAWNTTKVKEDPEFAVSAQDHKFKLANAVTDIRAMESSTGIEGLQAYEEEVARLLKLEAEGPQPKGLLGGVDEKEEKRRAEKERAAKEAAEKAAKGKEK
jgi:hypothetical protein